MPKNNYEENLSDLNIDDIFERKIEIGAVIQFSLLQKLIEEFIKRQKLMSDKINLLENKIESISFSQGITDINNNNINISSQGISDELLKNNPEKMLQEVIVNENETIKNQPKDMDADNQKVLSNQNDNKIEVENNNKEEEAKKKVNEEKEKDNKKLYNINKNNEKNNNEDKIDILSYKIDKLESMNKEIVRRVVSLNNENKNNIKKLADTTEDKIKSQNKIINQISENIKGIESKMNENLLSNFNLKDNTDNDQISTLIKGLNKKLNEKINILESYNKDNEEQVIKIKKEIVNLKNMSQTNTQSSNNLRENLIKMLNDFNALKSKSDKNINDLNKVIDNKIEELKKELLNDLNELNKKISDLTNEQNDLNKKNQNKNIDAKTLSSLNNEKMQNMSIELKHFFNKSISNTENSLKSLINNLGIEQIKSDLIQIQQELQNKLTKKDLDPINLMNNYKLDEIDTKIYELKNQNEDCKDKIDIIDSEIEKNKKKIDYLEGQIIKSYQPGLETYGKNRNINIEELKSYIKKDLFEQEIDKILKKIEKIFEFENENNKHIQVIDKKTEKYVTDNDLKNMQHYITNMIEEFKVLANKKFLEKKDAQKSFKYLELQIKTINENINLNCPTSPGDNWLLAKKPINKYLCASCESYIGDLKNKNEYLPWNRLSPREGKKYRMGHGFSRMLQMVNMDLMKNAEKINDDLSIKIEDNQNVKNFFENKLLPRLNSSKNVRKIKYKTNSVNSNMKMKDTKEYELNTSQINTGVNSSNYLNNATIGNRLNNSIDSINNNSHNYKISKLKKKDNNKEKEKEVNTFTKININSKE